MSTRPIVRAIIARRLPHGGIGRSRVVPLSTAYLALKDGNFFVVGPDPSDLSELATWERENARPFNPVKLP